MKPPWPFHADDNKNSIGDMKIEKREREKKKYVHEKLMKKSLFPLGCWEKHESEIGWGGIKKVKMAREGEIETFKGI